MENYQDLKHYLPPILEGIDDAEERRHHGRDTSCCALLFIILLLTTSVYVIAERRNVEQEFWVSERVETVMNYKLFKQIIDPLTASVWINQTLTNVFFIGGADYLLDYYEIVGNLIIRQCRSKVSDCMRKDLNISSEYKCYYSNTVGNEKFTENIGTGSDNWRKYQESTYFSNNFVGEFGVYDTSGFLKEYNTSQYTASSFNDNFITLNSQGWISFATRILFITCNLYERNYDLWVTVNIGIEFNINNIGYPSLFEIVALKPDIFAVSPGANTADVFRIIFSFYILYLYIGSILEIRDGKRNIKHIISFQGIMDLTLVIMVILSVAISAWINIDETSLYNNQTYVDLSPISAYYRIYHNINSTTLGLILARIVMFLTVNKRIYILIVSIEHAAKNVMSFVIILVSLLFAFSMIAQSLWGVHVFVFHKFTYAIIDLLLLSLGHGDFESILEVTEAWTILFFSVYSILIMNFLVSSFMGIYMDAYKIIRLQEGYTDDETTWTKSNILLWLIDWLPFSFKKKFYEKEKAEKNVDYDEEAEEEEDPEEKPNIK